MLIEDFNSLPEDRKMTIIVDAQKIGEYENGDIARYELFRVDNFYVEVKVSFLYRYRKIINAYDLKDVPLVYSGKVIEALA
ncbi:MAG: hypothetical protein JWQ09_316 [Segetibacter sp.]|nr:hypothetical protein [Segetibacter sp.]